MRRQRQIIFSIMLAVIVLLLVVLAVMAKRAEKTDELRASSASEGATASESAAGDAEAAAANEAGETDISSPTATPTPTPTPTPTEAPVQILVSAVGDCTLGTDVGFDESTSLPAKYREVGDPAYFLQLVKPIFEEDDITIVNLEGTLTEATERADKTFAFKGDPSYVQILTSGSVEAANLANNHSRDYGEQSYEDTIRYVEEAGIRTFGYARTAIIKVDGVKVGLTGTYELAKGMDCEEDLIAAIEDVKAQGAELVISSFHWGTERENYPESNQKELARAAIDAGADLVLGHHPHVLQGVEIYKDKYIVYSLGNFCFGGNKNPQDKDTMIFQQRFTVTNGEVQKDRDVTIIPCRLSSTSERNNYQPEPLEGEDAERVMNRLLEYSSGFEESGVPKS